MAKEKRNLYEEVEFGNDYGYAMQVKREAETQLYEIQKIWGLAIAGTVWYRNGAGIPSDFYYDRICYGLCLLQKSGWFWNSGKMGMEHCKIWLVCSPVFSD